MSHWLSSDKKSYKIPDLSRHEIGRSLSLSESDNDLLTGCDSLYYDIFPTYDNSLIISVNPYISQGDHYLQKHVVLIEFKRGSFNKVCFSKVNSKIKSICKLKKNIYIIEDSNHSSLLCWDIVKNSVKELQAIRELQGKKILDYDKDEKSIALLCKKENILNVHVYTNGESKRFEANYAEIEMMNLSG